MALPDSTETESTLVLREIVEEMDPEQMLGWPRPNDQDYALFGKITHIYSVFDFIIRYMAETMDEQDMFTEPWAGKTRKLTMAQVAEAIQSSPIWIGSNRAALEEIEVHRRIRNLVAHFVVRRFPEDDAYVFMTKSAVDFRRVYGKMPEGIDSMLYGVLDAAQLRELVPILEGLLKWAANVLSDLGKPISSREMEER